MSLAVLIVVVEVDAPLVENGSVFFAPTVTISKPKLKRGRPRRAGPSARAISKRLERERAAIYGEDYVLTPQIAMSSAGWLTLGLEGLSRAEQVHVLEELWAEFIAYRKKMR